MSSPPAGWYPDPEEATRLRYWDGASWTESRSPTEAPSGGSAAVQVSAAPVWVPAGGNVYESAADLDRLLTPEQREAYSHHTLTHFPTWLVVVLHYLTFGIFTLIYQGLKLSKLPLVRENDFRAGKGIGYCFIPFYSLYWVFRFVNAITDRLNFQLRLRGERPRVPRGLGITCCVFFVIPYGEFITLLILMPIMSAFMQSTTNKLVRMRDAPAAAGAES